MSGRRQMPLLQWERIMPSYETSAPFVDEVPHRAESRHVMTHTSLKTQGDFNNTSNVYANTRATYFPSRVSEAKLPTTADFFSRPRDPLHHVPTMYACMHACTARNRRQPEPGYLNPMKHNPTCKAGRGLEPWRHVCSFCRR